MTHYDSLGVNPSATQDEIKSAFRTLSKKHHPDAGGDEDKFKEISAAYQVLKDESSRKQYDHTRAFSQQSWQSYRYHDPNEDWMSEDIVNIFRQAYQRNAQQRSNTVRVNITLSLAELHSGISKRTIRLSSTESYDVDIPKGLRPGTIITFRGIVQPKNSESKPGDLQVNINIQAEPNWSIHGDDLVHTVDISIFDLMIGTTVTLSHIDGKSYQCAVPAGTQTTDKFKCSGLGLSRSNQRPGDMYITFNARVPAITNPSSVSDIQNIKQREI